MCWHGSTVEQLTCNQQVVGSIPIASSRSFGIFSKAFCFAKKYFCKIDKK
jgi:hypothetical protein